ncbi:Hsp20/alpha crystallin family protein [Patescibacteria group bacterium]|nr:Hsp20/alpha crystallin family protein [Patescibacteria group bacterium]
MTTFLEKLKKGMEGEESSEILASLKSVELTDELAEGETVLTKKEAKPDPEGEKLLQKTKAIKSGKIEVEFEKKSSKDKKRNLEALKTKEKEEKTKKSSSVKDSGGKSEDRKKWFEAEGQLIIDVYQMNGELIIQSAIAGVRPENLDISIERDMVLIKGNRSRPEETNGGNYFFKECYWGPFSRQIILPVETDNSRAKATMKEGILTIRIPEIERKKRNKIIVKGN